MPHYQYLPLTPRILIKINPIIVHRIRPRQHLTHLPEQIPRQLLLYHSLLPPLQNRRPITDLVLDTVFLQDDGFPDAFGYLGVFVDVSVPPVVRFAPQIGVHVDSAEVDRGDFEVGGEVYAFGAIVRVCVYAGGYIVGLCDPPLVPQGDHVCWVQAFDVLTNGGGPFGDNTRVATLVAVAVFGAVAVVLGFVADFPTEDRGRRFIAVDDKGDVGHVVFLCGWVREEGLLVGTVSSGVEGEAVHRAIGAIGEGKDDFHVLLFGGGDHVIEYGDSCAKY